MTQVTGRIFISVNGKRIRSKDGASLDTGGLKRVPALSDAGVDGFTEEVVAAEVECKINDTADIRIDAELRDFRDGTLVFETDTGKPYTLLRAFITDAPKLSKGEWTLKFAAVECIEG